MTLDEMAATIRKTPRPDRTVEEEAFLKGWDAGYRLAEERAARAAAPAPEALRRYWLVPATGFANAHMEPADDGEWVRFDAARAATPAAPEALLAEDGLSPTVTPATLDAARAETPAAPYEPVPGQSFVKRGPAAPAAPEAPREVPAWLEHMIDTLERGGGSVAYISKEHLFEVRAALDAERDSRDKAEALDSTENTPDPIDGPEQFWYVTGWRERGDAIRAALAAAPEPSGIDVERPANGERRAWDDPDFATWTCTIAGPYRGELEPGSDLPMRRAVAEAYAAVTGHPEAHLWSGWNGHARPLVQPADDPPEDFGESGPTWVRP